MTDTTLLAPIETTVNAVECSSNFPRHIGLNIRGEHYEAIKKMLAKGPVIVRSIRHER